MTSQPAGPENKRKLASICVVDDNKFAREVIADQLSLEPYQIKLASSGVELLEKFDELMPDVILMDVMMPRLSGYEVCQEIKQNEAWKHIPIILVTTLNSREDMLQGLASGADEFLSKPVNGAELRARVRTMLRIKNQFDELQSMMQLREDLANMLIHDMRTPLTVASLYNDFVLRQKGNSTKENKYALVVRDSLRDLDRFIDEILTTSKMEQGALKLERTQVNIKQLVTEIFQDSLEASELRLFDLKLEVPGEGRFVWLDVSLFKRVLDNLLTNAYKFSPKQSTVTLRLQYPETAVSDHEHAPSFCLQVLDTGPGIPNKDQERIFNKYEVVTMQKKSGTQVGLGLAFCKMVVEAHGGRIFVTSNEPQGAILTVEI